MKIWSLCLWLFAIAAHAQSIPEAAIASQLNSDLAALKALPAFSGTLAVGPEDQVSLQQMVSREQDDIMQHYSKGVQKFEVQRYAAMKYFDSKADSSRRPLRGFVSWSQAYTLTSVLAGKDLSEATLTPLTHAILGMMDSALVCLNTSARLHDSARFHTFAEQAYTALLALNVSAQNARIVMGVLLSNAMGLDGEFPPPVSYK